MNPLSVMPPNLPSPDIAGTIRCPHSVIQHITQRSETEMADRNPYIPSERRQDVETREKDTEEMDNRRFAEKQAKLREQGDPDANKVEHTPGKTDQ